MKKLILILCLALVGCSSEEIQEETITEDQWYLVFTAPNCPNLAGNTGWEVSKETHSRIFNYVRENRAECMWISFKDLNNNLREGYFAGESAWNE